MARHTDALAAALSATALRAYDDRGGVYAWWQSPNALPGVQAPAHPTAPLELLYVRIAPGRVGSSGNLRMRLSSQGPIESSCEKPG